MDPSVAGRTQVDRSASSPPPWVVLAIACLGQFLVVLDVSVVNVALPAMRSGLELSQAGLQWVVNAYVITFAGFMLLGGRAADVFGRKRTFVTGLGLFTVASLAGGMAMAPWQLITARAIQGVGAAVLAPATLTLVTGSFADESGRTRAIAVWTAVGAGGGAAGSLVGGVLTEFLSWRWVLLINVPVGALTMAGAVLWLAERGDQVRKRLDLPGAMLVSAGLALLAYGIVQTESAGWTAVGALLPLGAGLVVLAVFVVVEARLREPLMPLHVFRLRSVAAANAAMLAAGGVMFCMWFFLTLYMQHVLGYTPLRTGLSFLPHSVSIILGAQAAPRLMRLLGAKTLAVAGALIGAAGMVWQSTMTVDGTYLGTILGPGILMALGAGLTATPVAAVATSGAGPGETGLVSGLVNTSRQIGGALSLSVLSAVGAAHIHGSTDPGVLTTGYAAAFATGAAILASAAVLMLGILPGAPAHQSSATSTATRRDRSGSAEHTDSDSAPLPGPPR
ncbi:EmrB/QacA subfamily drug resistance transporter [Halopolyspora algeriensis]|uniref:EmrB/QacA subfamily drug resistance transporter n=1 Tax=Halopolyspora algeriensis TaxID=1500506 RepID=A0A368VMY6_9ACTN|nr:MFS transporter [Halopolyspora algeriensis]RCW41063.1 EmrB/QacA subfamily drug resistance transporter [Halopolyspora algeriensis]TQM53853.1 EmrB/QacA subfamily drug resistance transporter [Halopolyspora algeriensis]